MGPLPSAASTTLVNVTDDAETRFISAMAEVSGSATLETDCADAIAKNDVSQLISILLSLPSLWQGLVSTDTTTTDDATGAVAILAALCDRASSPAAAQQLCLQVADAIQAAQLVDKSTASTERKLALLSMLYNMRANPVDKCQVLQRLFGLASENTRCLQADQPLGRLLVEETTPNSHVGSFSPGIPRVVSMLDAWKIAAPVRRDLFRSIVAVLPADSTTDARHQRFVLLLVKSYAAHEVDDDEIVAWARQAVVGALRDPLTCFLPQRELLSWPAVQALATTEPQLMELLRIFQHGKLSDYQTFVSGQGGDGSAFLQSYGLHAAACQRYMKILSLASLAAEHEEIPYAVIEQTLQIDNVESWVIAAVQSQLLQAKMDQMKQVVLVERCVVRQMAAPQWQALHAKLSAWKTHVGSVLRSVKDAQIKAAEAAAAATSTP